MNDLKPCRFCGASAEIKSECYDYCERQYFVACMGCDAQMQFGSTLEEVTASWNRRAPKGAANIEGKSDDV